MEVSMADKVITTWRYDFVIAMTLWRHVIADMTSMIKMMRITITTTPFTTLLKKKMVGWVGCWSFMPWHHLWPYIYMDGYHLVTVRTHDSFIVLPYRKIRPPGPGPHIPFSCIILILSQPVLALLIMPTQLPISGLWLMWTSNTK